LLRFLDPLDTTNVLVLDDHLNQLGSLSTSQHAYVIRLNAESFEWEFINPGLKYRHKEHQTGLMLDSINEYFVDANLASIYELLASGVNVLDEATPILKQFITRINTEVTSKWESDIAKINEKELEEQQK
jgi:hypothetical protein